MMLLLGFHKKQYAVVNLITKQGWDPVETNTHPNLSLTLSGGYKFDVLGKKLLYLDQVLIMYLRTFMKVFSRVIELMS